MSKSNYTDTMRENFTAAFSRRPEAPAPVVGAAKPHEGRKQLPGACLIEIDRVVGDPDQPRTDWASPEAVQAIDDLAADIESRGQLQPIRVRWNGDIGKFQVIVGERRLRACLKAGIKTIACVVVEDRASSEDRVEDQLVENALRTNLTPIEAAKAYQRLIEAKGYSHRQLAERLHIPHPAVTQAMQLLTLPAPIQEAVDEGKIPAATGYEMSKVNDPAEQEKMAEEAVAGRLSRTQARQRVAELNAKGRGAAKPKGKASKPKPLPTSVKYKAPNQIKVTGERRKGFTPEEWLDALEQAASNVRESIAGQGDGPRIQASDAA